jgi:hypothetical protein
MRTLVALGLSVGLGVPRLASACGGFFCDSGGGSTGTPGSLVVQSAERIVFEVGDGRVRASIQVQYDGDPVDFAWVVPVPAMPTLGVGDPAVFDALDEATAPVFVFPPAPGEGGGDGSGGSAIQGGGCGCGSGGEGYSDEGSYYYYGNARPQTTVRILGTQNVGPYSTTIVTASASQDLVDWLDANVYDVPLEAEPIIDQYVEQGSVFVAVRLLASATVDLIQPLVIDYAGDEPCIPLRMTSFASLPGLEVLAWIVSDAQASPFNFAPAYVDDGEILDAGTASAYEPALDAAIDQYGGWAFVTEFAKPTSEVPDLTTQSAEAERIVRSGSYLTRLRTRLDPNEMTIDPIFVFDADLADVDNVHTLGASPYAGLSRDSDRALAGGGLAGLAAAISWALASRRRR